MEESSADEDAWVLAYLSGAGASIVGITVTGASIYGIVTSISGERTLDGKLDKLSEGARPTSELSGTMPTP